jgi:hypothetical protein
LGNKKTIRQLGAADVIVYHYTDANGLFGILKSRELWATDVRFLNDSTEVEFGAGIVRSVLEEERSAAGSTAERRNIKLVEEILERALYGDLESSKFAVSLSSDGDLLSQWRAYADFGAGYAIGLDLDVLTNVSGLQCLNVSYDPDIRKQEIRSRIASMVVEGRGHALTKVMRRDLLFRTTIELKDLILLTKHPAFADERELRLVSESHEISHRTRDSSVIPYHRIPLSEPTTDEGQQLLSRIVLGPSTSPTAREGVVSLLRSCDYDPEKVNVVPSGIPFRG